MKNYKILISLVIFTIIFSSLPVFADLSPLSGSPILPRFCKIGIATNFIICHKLSDFITFVPGTNMGITVNNSTQQITFNAIIPPQKDTLDTMQNIGTGEASVYAGNDTKTNFQFKTLKQGSGILLTNNTNDITISASGTSGVTSLNALTGALTIQGTTGNLTVNTSSPTITLNTAYNVVVTNGSPQTITKLFTLNNAALGGDLNIGSNGLTNAGHRVILPANSGTLLLGNSSGSSLTGITYSVTGAGSTTVSPNTGNVIVTGRTYQNNTGNNLGTSGSGVYSSMSGDVLQFLKLISANSNCSFSTNSTNVILTCSSSSGITSLNSDTTAAQNIVRDAAGNMTITNSTGQVKVGLGSNVVITGGSAQTVTKTLTINSLILGGDENVGSNAFTNSGHKSTLPSTTGTLCQTNQTTTCGASPSGVPVVLGNNVTSTSTTNFAHVWNIALTANSGNAIEGVLVASSNTAGGAVQVGANMSSTTGGSGICDFGYNSAATTFTTFAAALGTTSSDSAWTTILAAANQAYPIEFHCAVQTGPSPPTLQINFQAEVASTVSIKAGSHYIKTP